MGCSPPTVGPISVSLPPSRQSYLHIHSLFSYSVGASSIFTLLYGGEPILDNQDPIVVKINEVMHRLSEHAAPGKHFVEIFPFMKHLPEWMAGWKRMANSSFERDSRMFNEYIEKVEADMVRICFAGLTDC